MARVTNIYLRPSSRTPVKEVWCAEAVAGKRLRGDHAHGGNRQVSLIEKENWDAACNAVGHGDLIPGRRRANLVIEGFSLQQAVGRSIRVGECIIKIVGELRPCKLMDDVTPGLMKALSPEFRAGAYGRILKSGVIQAGAEVTLVEDAIEIAS